MPNLNHARLRRFLADMTSLVGGAQQAKDETAIVEVGGKLLGDLIAHDDWLPDSCATASAGGYQQHLLYCDPQERFSVVSFVWGPGAFTPVHDHLTWGLIGMLRGAESEERYERSPISGCLEPVAQSILHPGEIGIVSPTLGDIHRVSNALPDRASISIHVYGANIGAIRRHKFDLAHNCAEDFISGYSAAPLPNIWDRSKDTGV
jgi:predicted metal-dependent enzyme (double-stranded beta helix superfamily)